jgi:glycosyltransferase involved in cell wall biosynthesis
MAPPRFSIITVARNDVNGLQSTWRSLHVQEEVSWEWIVQDGDSSDGTAEWLSELDDSRLRWSSEKDSGVYDAMNKAIGRIRGDAVLFLNAGDLLTDSSVLADVWMQWSRLSGPAWAYGRVRVVEKDGRLIRSAGLEPFSARRVHYGYRSIPHQAAFFRRGLLFRLGCYRTDVGVIADQDLMLRAAAVERPLLLRRDIADYLAGGMSWGRAPDAFVRDARTLRLLKDRPVGGTRSLDRLITEVMALDKKTRDLVSRRVLRRGVRG